MTVEDNKNNPGIGSDANAASSTAQNPNPDDQGEGEGSEGNVPLHKDERFLQVNKQKNLYKNKLDEAISLLAKYEDQLKQFKSNNTSNYGDVLDENSVNRIKNDALFEAEIASKRKSLVDLEEIAIEDLIQEGFDFLADKGHKVTKSDKVALGNIISEYGLSIEKASDFEKAWKIYELNKKKEDNQEEEPKPNDKPKNKPLAIKGSANSQVNVKSHWGNLADVLKQKYANR